jgi:hypothetical protein
MAKLDLGFRREDEMGAVQNHLSESSVPRFVDSRDEPGHGN